MRFPKMTFRDKNWLGECSFFVSLLAGGFRVILPTVPGRQKDNWIPTVGPSWVNLRPIRLVLLSLVTTRRLAIW